MGRGGTPVPFSGKQRGGVVQAAGGILLRAAPSGRYQVAVVHRPHRHDWSLPKGKVDVGESMEQCALREVLEETGYRCRLSSFVGFIEYRDRRNRRKVVGYWIMDVVDGEFAASDEVDELEWLDLDMAERVLTYGHDRELISSLDTRSLARSG
jgi:8-oxo-dGTP diphosphatase